MICDTCRAAGTLNARGRDEEDKGLMDKSKETFRVAKELHKECKNCYCQHVVGERLHD